MWWLFSAVSLATELPAMSEDEKAAAFEEVMTAAAQGDATGMTEALTRIVTDETKAGAHGQAWAMLGSQLARNDFPLAAVAAFSKGFALDPAYGINQIDAMLDVAAKVGEDGSIGETLAAHPDLPVAPESQNRIRAAGVRSLLRQGEYGAALTLAENGLLDQPGFVDLELLRGVVLSQQQRYNDAIIPLLTAEAMARRDELEPGYLERTSLNVARAYYASGDFGRAIEFYAKVPRTSDVWLEAQFERAWSHFRGQDTNGALAMLHNHQAPFFAERFDPEADLLRAYSLFLMCKFGQASQEMEAFPARWQPVIDATSDLSAVSPSDALGAVRNLRADAPTSLPASAIRSFRREPRMTQALASIDLAATELQGLKDEGPLGELVIPMVEAQRDARIEVEGRRVLDKVQGFSSELYDMLTDIELARVDLLTLEAEMLQRAAVTGVRETVDDVPRLKKLRKRRGFRPWPWKGEYWADEVGWYVFAARPDCPATMTRDEEAP